MEDLERRAAELCASPTGCVFLLLAEAARLSPAAVADPWAAVQIAAQAVGETISFQTHHDWLVPRALGEGSRLLPFARSVLEQPVAEGWFAPLDRAAQEWIGPTSAEPPITGEAVINPTPSAGELFGQEPRGGVVTSTGVAATGEVLASLVNKDEVRQAGNKPVYRLESPERQRVSWSFGDPVPVGLDENSSAVSALLYHSGDYEVGEPPLIRYLLQAAADLRVFEVDGPQSWHALSVRFPAQGEEGRLVPNWESFSREWDAVHLTLGGLLTADQVRVESEAGWTKLELWEFEHTHWLRWRFETIERLPDLATLRDAPLWLPDPPALEPPPGVGHRVRLVPRA